MAEAGKKERQSTDVYSNEGKGEKEANQFYKTKLCQKGAGHDREKIIRAAHKYEKSLAPINFFGLS